MKKWIYVGYVRAHTHDVRALTLAVPISREGLSMTLLLLLLVILIIIIIIIIHTYISLVHVYMFMFPVVLYS
jgi:hypothetical protein